MIPIIPLVVVAGGVLFAVHKRRQKARLRKKKPHRPVRFGEGVPQKSRATTSPVNVKRLLQDTVDALLFTERQQLQVAMDPVSRKVREQQRQKGRRQIQLSLGAVGLASLASFYPMVTPAAVLAILYLMRETFKLIWKDFKDGRYLSLYLVGIIVTLGLIAIGHLILAAFVGLMEGFFASIINKLENSSQRRLVNVFSSHPEKVWVVQDGVELEVSFHDLQEGEKVRVNAGEVMPVDGRIMEGFGQVDQHILTGESQPVDKEVGDKVFASTLLLSGRLTVEVLTAGEHTVTAKIGQVLNETQSYKDTVILRGRKIADNFIPVKLGIAAATVPLLGPNAGLAVMFADLGGGLGISGAMSVTTYLQILARQQILVKDGRVFESLQAVDTVVFDKTGTLTQEQPTLGSIHAVGEFTEREVLRLVAAAEYRQPHPVARAILARAKAAQLDLPALEETSYEVGYGIKVGIEGRIVRVGSAHFLQREDIALPDSISTIRQRAEADSHSLIYVAVDDQLVGLLEMKPTIRPEAREMVRVLKQRGMDVYIISGDHEAPTRSMARKLGVEHYFAEILPENKAVLVQQLRDEGRFVCFVGDGINDAIALKAAQVSVSLKGASTAATDTAQIIFMDGTLKNLLPLFALVDEFEETMHRNMVVGFTPGVLTISGVFFLHFGVVTSMLILYSSIFGELINVFWPLAKHQEQFPEPSQKD
uniref:P-type Zn(2+) transporter n=1 Tax=Candidatus Kentrum sp. LPFa TaxID=2126335 RepID=A0A450WCS7_9GAMM|nr:MAG: Cu2+-exporting ATPase [Candidatus Kentron sp. LPFa]